MKKLIIFEVCMEVAGLVLTLISTIDAVKNGDRRAEITGRAMGEVLKSNKKITEKKNKKKDFVIPQIKEDEEA